MRYQIQKKSCVAERNGIMGYMGCSAYPEKSLPHIAHVAILNFVPIHPPDVMSVLKIERPP